MEYRNFFKEYSENGNIDFDHVSNGLTFINKGGADVTINNTLTLSTNDNLAIGGNQGEVDVTTYNITFTAGAVGTKKLIIISKVYVG